METAADPLLTQEKSAPRSKEFNVRMAAVFGSRGFRMWPFEGWGCPFPFGAGHKKMPVSW